MQLIMFIGFWLEFRGRFLPVSGFYLAILIVLFPISSYAETEQKLFSISGSNTVGALLGPELAKGYLSSLGAIEIIQVPETVANESVIKGWLDTDQRWLLIPVAAHGSSSGFKALKAGQSELAAASRRVKGKEVKALKETFGDLRAASSEHTVALDGLAIIVHPDNPIQSLNLEQVARIFAGEISNWKQLGGQNLSISLYARDEVSGTWDTFKSLVLAKHYKLSSDARRFESNQELSNRVSRDSGGIGFVSLNTIKPSKAIAIASSENSPAMMPDLIRVATEDYPLARRLYLYLPEDSPDLDAQAFVEFALSDLGQQIVTETGYISQEIRALDTPIVQQAPPIYRENIKQGIRLSVNFRFEEGKARLDSKAKRDLVRLQQFSESMSENQKLLLVGFAEGAGQTRNAQLLSSLRAGVVKRALMRQGVPNRQLEQLGVGAYMGLSDKLDLVSKVRNRRVEVWMINEDEK